MFNMFDKISKSLIQHNKILKFGSIILFYRDINNYKFFERFFYIILKIY